MQLLADRATEGLDSARSSELERLLSEHPEYADDGMELAAAAIDQALSGPAEPLPGALRERLMATAAGFSASRNSGEAASFGATDGSDATPRPTPTAGPATTTTTPETAVRSTPGASTRADVVELRRGPQIATWGGWLAAAAALVLAALAWWPGLPAADTADVEPREPVTATVPAAEARERLLAEAADLVRIDWSATEDEAADGAGGDVVWSPSRQAGFMRISGLQANDPEVRQYQLWVFDALRDERFPVDGGVFDIPAGADEVIVPIDTRLRVDAATLFAVTVEPPGGVVVSDRERIVLVATAEG